MSEATALISKSVARQMTGIQWTDFSANLWTNYTLAIGADTCCWQCSLTVATSMQRLRRKVGGDPEIETKIVTGCTLTDDGPDDNYTIIWHSGNCGWIIDENNRTWRYVVKAAQA